MALGRNKFTRLGGTDALTHLPNRCWHAPEHVLLEQDSYNDGGLRVVVYEWHCCLCHRVVRRRIRCCDIGQEP